MGSFELVTTIHSHIIVVTSKKETEEFVPSLEI